MMETPDTSAQIPNTIEGMAIHLSYLRRDSTASNVKMDAVIRKLDDLANIYVSNETFRDHLKADEDHENRIRLIEEFRDTLTGKLLSASVFMGLIFSAASLLINHYWK